MKSIHVKKGGIIYDSADHVTKKPHEIQIKWTGGKNIFKFTSIDDKEAKILLQNNKGRDAE